MLSATGHNSKLTLVMENYHSITLSTMLHN